MTSPRSGQSGSFLRVQRNVVRGFTLVEVVVALGILSLIMLATISALRTFGNTQQSVDRLTGRVDDIRSVSVFLRDTLQAAVIASEEGGGLTLGGGGGSTVPPYFKGDARSLEWKAPVMFGESYGGIFLVRLAWEEGELVLRWQEPGGEREEKDVDWTDTPRRTLVAGVEKWEVSYRPAFDLPWQESWEDDEEGNPALVRMVIKAGGRFWPDLILQVQR